MNCTVNVIGVPIGSRMSTGTNTNDASKMIDGNIETYWNALSYNGSMLLQFPKSTYITSVLLNIYTGGSNYQYNYYIYNESSTLIGSALSYANQANSWIRIFVPAGNYNYLQIQGNSVNNSRYYTINEVWVTH